VPTRFKARVTKCVEPIQAMVPNGCLYGLPSDPDDVQCLIQASLHGIDDGLALPALDAALLAGRALRPNRTGQRRWSSKYVRLGLELSRQVSRSPAGQRYSQSTST